MGLGVASLVAVAGVAAPIPDPFPTALPHYQGAPANDAGLALGRDGTAYLGVIGGIVALREP